MLLVDLFGRATLNLLGWALIPTPPSPVPDFGLQLLFSLIVGLAAPKVIIKPVNLFIDSMGVGLRVFFGLIPGIRILTEKVDGLIDSWKDFLRRERHSDNMLLNKIYGVFGREDIIERMIFGYFFSVMLGIALIGLSIFI